MIKGLCKAGHMHQVMVQASAGLKAHHDEGEDSQTTASNPSVVHTHGSAVIADQLNTSIDVTVQPVDLHTGAAAHQQAHKGGSEDTISVEVPVIAEPDAASTNKAVAKVGDQQTERFPVVTCTGRFEHHSLLRACFGLALNYRKPKNLRLDEKLHLEIPHVSKSCTTSPEPAVLAI